MEPKHSSLLFVQNSPEAQLTETRQGLEPCPAQLAAGCSGHSVPQLLEAEGSQWVAWDAALHPSDLLACSEATASAALGRAVSPLP